jgi:hypothetical protein
MRILVGTPVHASKDYSIEKWLANIALIQQIYPMDVFIVDNSDTPRYSEILKNYCLKHKVKNYSVIHIEEVGSRLNLDERLSISREVIRHEVLDKEYGAWFSWECDIIIPPEVVGKLIRMSKNYSIIGHAYPHRIEPDVVNAELGITLINRKVLEEFSFLNSYGHVDPINPNCAYGGDVWFCVWARRRYGRKYTHVYKTNQQIYHLDK